MKKCFLRAFAATGIALFSQAFFISSATADTLKTLTTGAFKQVVVAVAADAVALVALPAADVALLVAAPALATASAALVVAMPA